MIRKLLHKDVLAGTVLLTLCIMIWVYSSSFPELNDGYPGPSLFPRIMGVSLGLMGFWLIVRSLGTRRLTSDKRLKNTRGGLLRLFVAVGIVSTYPLLITYVHFIPIMAVLIVVFGFLLKNKAWQAMLTASLSALLIYALFTKLLGVPL